MGNSGNIAHFSVTLDERTRNSISYSKIVLELEQFLVDINLYITTLKETKRLNSIVLTAQDAPYIYVGNPEGFNAPIHLNLRGESGNKDLSPDETSMVLYTLEPSLKWKENLHQIAIEKQLDYFLYITLGFGEYFPKQIDNWGNKEVILGTGYKASLKWLTSLEDPIEVLQFTGVLLNRNGEIIRGGAEAFFAKPKTFFESIIKLSDPISEKDIADLKFKQRDDLTDTILVWQIALHNLVGQLLQKEEMIIH